MHPRTGFSLIELSIVLVILGLLTGGILAGQSLIRASELRAVTSESQRYAAAMNTFRDKYMAMPGDMSGATKFWGFSGTTASPGCVTNSSAATATPGTCDGNGNGLIEYGSAASATSEAMQAWKQLALAGLVEGSYSGNAGPVGTADYLLTATPNAPRSKISNTGWMLSYIKNDIAPTYSSHLFLRNYLNWMGAGAGSGTGSWLDDPFLKNEEAWNIDTKLDDGLPAQGKVQAMGMDLGCTTGTGSTDFTVTYALSVTSISCSLLFNYNG